MRNKVVVTSAHTAHYVGVGDAGMPDDWLWTRSFARAHRFASEAEAVAFVAAMLAGTDVWYLKNLY